MDRFFSKLDLRDIKIDPHSSSFPPDADDEPAEAAEPAAVEPEVEPETASAPPVAAGAEPARPAEEAEPAERQPYVPAWSPTGDGAAANGLRPAEVADPAYAADEAFGVQQHGEILKVSARSRPSAVAGAIAGVVREAGRAEVQAIGAGATNQAVKAVAIARDYLRETGIEAVCLPAFIDVTIENEDRTAIRLVVEPR
jgi:stage V sporulation protein S